MNFGFYLPTSGPTARPEPLAEMARQGDALGFHSMVIADHIVLPQQIESAYPYTLDGVYPGAAVGECLEQLTVLTFLAGITRQIRLVPSVMIVPYRNPVVTAKMLATLDVLSNGRVTLGVGVGWMEEEFQALAAPPFAERGAVTNEYLQIYKELWTSETPLVRRQILQFLSTGLPAQAGTEASRSNLGRRPEQARPAAGSHPGKRLAPGGGHPLGSTGTGRPGGRRGPDAPLRRGGRP